MPGDIGISSGIYSDALAVIIPASPQVGGIDKGGIYDEGIFRVV